MFILVRPIDCSLPTSFITEPLKFNGVLFLVSSFLNLYYAIFAQSILQISILLILLRVGKDNTNENILTTTQK